MSTRATEEVFARKIKAYWARRGLNVNIHMQHIDAGFYCIRSDMKGGLPTDSSIVHIPNKDNDNTGKIYLPTDPAQAKARVRNIVEQHMDWISTEDVVGKANLAAHRVKYFLLRLRDEGLVISKENNKLWRRSPTKRRTKRLFH